MKILGIFGASGMAREVGDIAYEIGLSPIYIARDQTEVDNWTFPEEVISEADVLRYSSISCVIGIGDNRLRQQLAQRFEGKVRFSNLIHPSATFGRGQREIIESQRGVIVCAGVRFTNHIQVGNFGIFNQNATIAHDVVIDDFVHVASGSVISGNVHISKYCWIGAGATVNQGASRAKLQIGEGTLIGSGAVVVKSCDANAIYVGVPAKRLR